MGRKSKQRIVAVLLIVLVLALIGVGSYFIAQQSLSGFDDGYIPYGTSDVAISNASTCKIVAGTTPNSPAQGSCSPGQYWNLHIDGIYNGGWRGGWGYSGSDSDFSLGLGTGSYGDCGSCSELSGDIQTSESVKGKNFKFDTSISFGGNGKSTTSRSVTFSLRGSDGVVTDIVTKSFSGGKYDTGLVVDGTVELQWSILDPNKVQVNYQGAEVGVYTITSPDVYFMVKESIAGGYGGDVNVHVRNSRWQPVISCTKEADEISALETFREGQEVGLFATRYPVQKLCGTIITTPTGVDFSASREIEAQLVRGDTINVPQGSTWSMLYITKTSASMPILCTGDKYLYGDKCLEASGILQICTFGQTDADTGICAVQPEKIVNCDGRYDVDTNTCYINPPSQFVTDCSSLYGSEYTYNALENKCVSTPKQYILCDVDNGYNYDSTQDACIKVVDNVDIVQTKIECQDDGGVYYEDLGWCVKTISGQTIKEPDTIIPGKVIQEPDIIKPGVIVTETIPEGAVEQKDEFIGSFMMYSIIGGLVLVVVLITTVVLLRKGGKKR